MEYISHKTLHMLPKTADIVVSTCVSLHNFVMTEEEKNGEKDYSQEFIYNDHECMCTNIQWLSNEQNLNTRAGLTQRELLCDYFTTPAGRVEWQDDFVRRGLYAE